MRKIKLGRRRAEVPNGKKHLRKLERKQSTHSVGLVLRGVPVEIGQRAVVKALRGGARVRPLVTGPAGVDGPAVFVLHKINSFRCSRDRPMSAHPGGVAGLAPAAADAVGLAG